MGSSREARRAGSHEADTVIPTNSTTIAMNVSGSVGVTPTSMVVITRVTMAAAIKPRPMPAALSRNPSPTMS